MKKSNIIFFLSLISLSATLFLISFLLKVKLILLAPVYMFTPFISTMITVFCSNIPFNKLGISLKFNRWFIVAWFLPVIIVFATMGISLFFPNVEFSSLGEGLLRVGITKENLAKLNERFSSFGVHPILYFLLQAIILGPTINALFAFGEEIGWRGFLLRNFQAKGFIKSSILIGIIWGIWHFPLILQGYNYPEHPVIGVFMMIVFTTLLSPILNFIRIKSKSVLAPSIMHGMINVLAGIAMGYVKGGDDLIVGFGGLSGFIVLLITDIFLIIGIKSRKLKIEEESL